MPTSFAPRMLPPCALLLVLSGTACTRPPPPPEQKPEPQAHAQLREATRAPIEKARAVEGAVQEAADQQKAAIDAAAGG